MYIDSHCHITCDQLYSRKDEVINNMSQVNHAMIICTNEIELNRALQIKEQYENMEPYVKKDPRPVNRAIECMKKLGMNPKSTKIRGGTDGATMSKMGLVTPNLGTGSANHHGRYEYLVVQDFLKMIELVKTILISD